MFLERQSGFFMDYIAGHEDRWVVRTMYEAILDYCFPVKPKGELRTQLSKSTQGSATFETLCGRLIILASHFPDVNERTVIQTFWNGLSQNIRIRLIEWDMSPETYETGSRMAVGPRYLLKRTQLLTS